MRGISKHVGGSLLALLLLSPHLLLAQEDPYQHDAQAACFEGLDLQQAGDHEGAIARFILALSYDPSLYQAHLLLAESYLQLDMREEALGELTAYLEADFPEADTERAQALFLAAGGDPDTVPRHESPPPGHWTVATVEAGAMVEHHDNQIGLTVAGPTLGARFLPWRHLELSVRARLGVGPWPDHEGTIRVPSVTAGVAASFPMGRVRLNAGIGVPVVFSHNNGQTRADGGIMGEVGVRVSAGGRLVLDGRFSAGYLVRPVVGGGVGVGVQIGPMNR